MRKNYFRSGKLLLATFTLLSTGASLKAQIVQTYSYTGAVQTLTIPTTCVNQVTIECLGAQGGGENGGGGRGARMVGIYTVTPGMVLNILVGQQGQLQLGGQTQNSSGGGGGSFVWTAGPTLLVAAGGGGGLCNYNSAVPPTSANEATVGPNGFNGDGVPWSGIAGTGGINGAGGSGGTFGGTFDSGGGAGWLGNTGGPHDGGAFPGFAGGTGYCGGGGGGCGGVGGYGGGGGGGNDYGGGGGGGGYSGGGGGSDPTHGGGGGSFSSGTNQNNTSAYQTGNGRVTISYNTNGNGVLMNSTNPNICPGGSVSLNASNVVSYTWTPGNSNAQNIQVSPANTTTYSVSGTNVQGCISTAVLVVTVNPVPSLSITVSKNIVCVGDTALLVASGANTYIWNTGPTTASAIITPTTNSNTTYTVTGTSTAGCISSAIVIPNVNTNVLTTSGNTVICIGKQTQLIASGAVGPYSWTDNSTGAVTPFNTSNVSPTVNTSYTGSGIDANGCKLTQTITVAVNPNPTVNATASPSLLCKGNAALLSASGASTYSWSTGAGTSTISVNPPINTTYNYTVTGTDANGCVGSKIVTVRVELCTGISESGIFTGNLRVYPNPSNGLYHIGFNAETPAGLTGTVYNAQGALIKSQTLSANNAEIDLRAEAAGIYFLQLKDAAGSEAIIRLVKE